MVFKDIKAGLKGWLEGDKKKEAFREKVKEAVADGRLDAKDLKEIEATRQELGVTEARDDRTVIRKAIYNEAVAAVKKEGEISQTDAHELDKIQKFLPPPSLTIMLDIAPETAVQRKAADRDRYERDLAMQARVRESYLGQASAGGWIVLDGERSRDAIAADVVSAVQSRLGPP